MFQKMFKFLFLSSLTLITACTSMNRVPRAINKPKNLPLGETKRSAPISMVEREEVSAYTPYSISETTKKLFDFSNPYNSQIQNTSFDEYTAYERRTLLLLQVQR